MISAHCNESSTMMIKYWEPCGDGCLEPCDDRCCVPCVDRCWVPRSYMCWEPCVGYTVVIGGTGVGYPVLIGVGYSIGNPVFREF